MSALPSAYVDIWPTAGGSIHLSSFNGGVLSVSTFKDIWDGSSGNFEILLPPGGPFGPDATPQWIDILTPMSLVIIGLQRSVPGQPRAHIVMAGVLTDVVQSTEWRSGAGVRRVCRVTGQDFSYFFAQDSAYCSTLLAFTLLKLPNALSAHGLASGPPEQIAATYYDQIMAGKGGIMADTKFQYNGSPIAFSDLVQTDFRKFPGLPLTIPNSYNYLAIDGTWLDSFHELFPFPWYEFAILTEEITSNAQLSIGDVPFFAPVSPVATARPLPIPKLTGDGTNLDTSLWDALPVYTPDGNAVLADQQGYGIAEVRNFYVLNPVYLNTLAGNSNQQTAPFLFQFAMWLDADNVHTYGYRPSVQNIYWMADQQGQQAQQNAGKDSEFDEMVGTLALVPVSYHHPTPLMAQGAARLNLRPDIAPGVRFEYFPDKALTPWLAYVRSVSHSFVFGEACTTTLGLTRALPVEVYADHDLLLSIIQGKGARIDGQYTISQTATGIKPFNGTTATSDLQSLANAFTTPGVK